MKDEFRTLLRCDALAPIFWPEKTALGAIDVDKRTATFAANQVSLHLVCCEGLWKMWELVGTVEAFRNSRP